MNIHYLSSTQLSNKAKELVHFDVDSIRQVVAGRHGEMPRYWLADPEQYEQNGRPLRDSTAPRLLAYCPEGRLLYTNDGCNSCTHAVAEDLGRLSTDRLMAVAAQNKIPQMLLARMVELVRQN